MQIYAKNLKNIEQLLGGRMICLVGGGGKTTLMYALAQHRARLGEKVVVGTTTHIFMPPQYFAADKQQAENLWIQKQPAVIGNIAGEKLTASPALLSQLRSQADITFLEADGARRYPCKVPAAHEPVIDYACDLVVAVFGLSAIGKPLGQVCFRSELASRLLGVTQSHILAPLDAAKMLASTCGGKKGVGSRRWCAVLNQCDDGLRRKYAEEVTQHLEEMGETNVVMTTFDEKERAQWSSI